MGALRILLALSVVAAHTSAIRWLPLPSNAIPLFFVISGFYMALILNEKYTGRGAYRLFLANRFARIYPIYFLVAGVTAAVALTLHTEIKLFDPERLRELGAGARALLFGSNLTIFGLDTFDFLAIENHALIFVRDRADYATIVDHMRLLPQAWSLSPELLFYLIAPLFIRRVGRICAVGLLSLCLRLLLWQDGYAGFRWQYEFFPTELVFFATGALLYHAQRTPIFTRWAPSVASFAPFAAGLALFTFDDLPPILANGLVIASIPFLFFLTKRNSLDRLIGDLSYPIYMVHFLLIYTAGAIAPEFSHSGRFSSVCAVLSVLLALPLYRWVTLPIDRWRDQRNTEAMRASRRSLAQNPIAGIAAPATD